MAKKKKIVPGVSWTFNSRYLKSNEMGSLTAILRTITTEYINKTPMLPEHIKPLIKRNLIDHINFIGGYLGTLELLWRRENHINNNRAVNMEAWERLAKEMK